MAKRSAKKKKYKDFIVRLLMILAVVVVILITYKFISNLGVIKVKDSEFELYQYVVEQKMEYKGILEMSDKDNITKLTTANGELTLDSVPVYYKNEPDKAILPVDMAVVFPLDKIIKKVNSLSSVYIQHGDVYIKKGKLNRVLKNAFLYDGNDVYFFIENTVITVDGVEYKLPPLSYANVTYKGYVNIYNYDTDELIYIEEVENDVTAKTSTYTINLSNNIIKVDTNEQILLKRIKNLSDLENN